MTTYEAQPTISKENYTSLDGLRAYAAIGIVMMHVQANMNARLVSDFLTDRIIPWFTNFTLLFMIVSAFSMCCGYYERIKNGIITPSKFYSRRYKRIWPFFAIMVTIAFVSDPSINTLNQAFADLTLCFNLLPNPNIEVIGVGWFLGTIFTFYIAFPFFTFLLDSKKRAWTVLLLSLIFSYIAIKQFNGTVMEFDRTNIINSAPFFTSGGLIFLYRDTLCNFVCKRSVLVFSCCVILNILLFVIPKDSFFVLPDLAVFTSWLIYAIGSSSKWLNNRFTRHISNVSLEIYLCHMMFFRIVSLAHLEKFIHQTDLLYALNVVLTLVLATLFSVCLKQYLLKADKIKFLQKFS